MTDVVQADAARLPIRSESIDCIVTSPPYNLGMAYDGVDDFCPPEEYRRRAGAWSTEMARVLVPGGRCFVNVPTDAQLDPAGRAAAQGQKRGQSRWPPDLVWRLALAEAGLAYRMLIVWEQFGKDAPCSWGSWLSPNAPNVRGRHEAVLWFYRPPFARGRSEPNDCPSDAFLEITKSIWSFATAKRGTHPAPFPAELVRRCLWLATWPGDIVLDPFVGSGTTIYEARRLGRVPVGLELSAGYCREIAHRGEALQLFGPVPNPDQPTKEETCH
jgi:site-specific DNA-methyltransferase (adenine-specific)